MDIQEDFLNMQIAYEKNCAVRCNCSYEELKAQLDKSESLFGTRYLEGSPRHENWLLWVQAWQAAKSQAVPEGFVLIKESDRDREICELIDERDHLEDQAEQLKDKLQNLYVVDFGEHSNCNFPFQNAIDFDDSDLVLVKKDHLSEAVEKIELMFEEDSTLALGELLPIQQGIKALIEAQEQKG